MENYYYLGLNLSHVNPSACLIHNGELVAHAEEERFIRRKLAFHEFPINAIKYCLEFGNIELDDIEVICLGYDFDKFALDVPIHYLKELHKYPEKDEKSIQWEIRNLIRKHPRNIRNYVKSNLKEHGYEKIPQIKWYSHHYCHAQSALYSSGFDDSLVVVIDGVGETECFTVWEANTSKDIKKICAIELPHTLGWIYRAFTVWAGFEPYEGEGKLMGLAPYGEPSAEYRRKMEDVIKLDDNPYSYKINPYYLYVGKRSYNLAFTDLLVEKFGMPRKKEEEIEKRHKDVAFAFQERIEIVIERVVRAYLQKTGKRKLSLTGGVALNCKANGYLWEKAIQDRILDEMFVYPIATDDSIGIGSAMIYHQRAGRDMSKFKLADVYLGPSYDNHEIKRYIDNFKLRKNFLNENQYRSIIMTLNLNNISPDGIKDILNSNDRYEIDGKVKQVLKKFRKSGNIIEETAIYLADGKIVAWFQGRMEVGPRALGNRSILANPADKDIKNKINNKVKFRETWRPFCPTVLNMEVEKYFENTTDSPYMINSFKTKKEKIDIIPSVVHVDGTARLQILNEEHNPKYYNLISKFFELTGIPILLNTSLNIKGEPIVCTPEEALNLFFSTGIDVLVLNDYILVKDIDN